MRASCSFIDAILVVTLAASVAGCFNPTVKDGGFSCDPTQTPSCPDGFVCVGGRCHSAATAGGDGADLGSRADQGNGAGDMASLGGDMRSAPSADMTMGGGSCAHSLCTTGAKLSQGCDPCVTQICAQDNYCCVTKWSSQCVQEVTSICSRSCP